MPRQLNQQEHVSQSDMEQLVLDGITEWTVESIEKHLGDCPECQAKLLAIAADDGWRREFSDGFAGLTTERDFPMPTVAFDLAQIDESEGDQFDLKTAKASLEEILEPPRHPEMMGRLERYDIEGIIGCGGMGVVLRGFDRDLNRPVAVKMILPRLAHHGTAKQRFAREARAAAAVLHPNVISIHGISETAGVPWFAMSLIAGASLQTLVDRNGPLPEREIVRIGIQIASGLAAAHAQGLVHRDVKPANIMIDNQVNRVVITDFGLAQRDTEESMTRTGLLAGTLHYMSPEQSRGEEMDGRSDLFSLGALLYFLATGEVPFRADSSLAILNRIGQAPHAPVQSRNPEISSILSAVIDRLLEKEANARFHSAVELETCLTDYLAHLHQPLKHAAPRISKLKKRSLAAAPRKGIALAVAGIALFLVGGVVLNWAQFDSIWNNKNANMPPAVKEPALDLNWPTIQQTYGLQTPTQFEEDLGSLEHDIQELLENDTEASAAVTNFVDVELLQLSSDIRRLEMSLEQQIPLEGSR